MGGPPASYTTGPVNHLRFYPGGGGSEPQMDTGAPLQLCEGHAMGVGAKKKKQLKNPTHMGAYFFKKWPLEKLWQCHPYRFKNLLNPTLMGAFRACKTPSCGCKFFKSRAFVGAHPRRPKVLKYHPPGFYHYKMLKWGGWNGYRSYKYLGIMFDIKLV